MSERDVESLLTWIESATTATPTKTSLFGGEQPHPAYRGWKLIRERDWRAIEERAQRLREADRALKENADA